MPVHALCILLGEMSIVVACPVFLATAKYRVKHAIGQRQSLGRVIRMTLAHDEQEHNV